MEPFDLYIVYSFIAANVILYGLLVLGYWRERRPISIPEKRTPSEAFAFLERSFKLTYPDIRDGYTWSELIARARNTDLYAGVNWRKVQKALKDYEGYRYGEKPEPGDFDSREILKLGYLLQYRTKGTASARLKKILVENE